MTDEQTQKLAQRLALISGYYGDIDDILQSVSNAFTRNTEHVLQSVLNMSTEHICVKLQQGNDDD